MGDRGGRRRAAAEWRQIVAEQRRSGESVAAFAATHGLNRHTLQWWRSHLRKVPGDGGGVPEFVEIRAPRSECVLLEAELPSGVIVRGPDGEQVARLVAALMRPC